MHISYFVAVLLPTLSLSSLTKRNYETHDYYAVHLAPRTSPEDFAAHLGLEVDRPLGPLEDHWVLRAPRHDGDRVGTAVQEHKLRKMKRDVGYSNALLDSLLLHEKQKLKPMMEKRSIIPRQEPGAIEPPGSQFEGLPTGEDSDAPAAVPETVGGAIPATGESPTLNDNIALSKQKEIIKTLNINDPIFGDQWHLLNTAKPGFDLNVVGLWAQGITGKNTTACIVDDGLDMESQDLAPNYYADGSYDFNDNRPQPKPMLADDRHGTRCAGEVSAARNNVCGVGVAYDSKIAGVRILSAPISDADEAEAMTYKYQHNMIYSCSWGPSDNGKEMAAPGIFIKRAMLTAIQKGRNGLGSIYVFAAGNGAAADDNCNFDGYTNSIYSVTVGAIDSADLSPYYSEKCSAQLIVAYSSGNGQFIHTTDVGRDQCYGGHGGTSAAGPLAVGVIALALGVRPDLTWRDIQWLTVLTAAQIDQPSDWQTTTIGRNFSHQYGYGKLDAAAFVEKAKTFKNVKPQAWYYSPWQHIRHSIPQGDRGLASTFIVPKGALQEANFERVEHVTVTMNVAHTRRGDLSVELRSPSGVLSHLSTARKHDDANAGYLDWTFMSVAHWGESGEGAWTIIIKDTVENEHNGTFTDWKLNLYGECIDAEIQTLLPLPTSQDDADHEKEVGHVHTTSIVPDPPHPTEVVDLPADHPHRPTRPKPKPGSTQGDQDNQDDQDDTVDEVDDPAAPEITEAPAVPPPPTKPIHASPPADMPADLQPTVAFDAPFTATGLPSFIPEPSDKPSPDFLFHGLPTFGLSKHTQMWMYAAVGLMSVFCIFIVSYFMMARRKRARSLARDNYEFDELPGEDLDDIANDISHAKGGKRHQRAGELYDAFAGESDEETFSEDERHYHDEEKHYHDEDPLHEKNLGNLESSSDSSRSRK